MLRRDGRSWWATLGRGPRVWLAVFSAVALGMTVLSNLAVGNAATPSEPGWLAVLAAWVVSPLAAVTGVVCVVLCARGHVATWWWGLVNSVLYGAVAWVSGYYGDWLLNWFFFVPTQVAILVAWRGRLDADGIARMRRLGAVRSVAVAAACIISIATLTVALVAVDSWFARALARGATAYGALERLTGMAAAGPALDATTTVLQIAAEILLIGRYAEQWILWIVVNAVSIVMWTALLAADPTTAPWSAPALAMWLAFLANSVYGALSWYRGSRGRRQIRLARATDTDYTFPE